MTDRCPFSASCWMGGGSYACVKTPPFCKEPLIPKENETTFQGVNGPVTVCAICTEPVVPIEQETPIQSAIKQGELF